MSWEIIEAVKPNYETKNNIPTGGLFLSARRAGKPPRFTHYIALIIGADLAKKAAFAGEMHRCHILVGGGSDAGSIKIQIDNQSGQFIAKRQKSGNYLVSINAASARDLFSLNFEKFAVPHVEIVRPENGQPVFFTCKPHASLFAVED
jgi:hypothetical protein